MCRNIKTLFNFEPPATDDEIRAASLQFVRKISGFNTPSKANQAAFNPAIEAVFQTGPPPAGQPRDPGPAPRPRGGGRPGEGAECRAFRPKRDNFASIRLTPPSGAWA